MGFIRVSNWRSSLTPMGHREPNNQVPNPNNVQASKADDEDGAPRQHNNKQMTFFS